MHAAYPISSGAFNFPIANRPAHMRGVVHYKLHLPTYNGISDLSIGVTKGASCTPLPDAASAPKPIVWYGTSIAQGCCASRPGQIFTNQISRHLTPQRDIYNLGFSGSGARNTLPFFEKSRFKDLQ